MSILKLNFQLYQLGLVYCVSFLLLIHLNPNSNNLCEAARRRSIVAFSSPLHSQKLNNSNDGSFTRKREGLILNAAITGDDTPVSLKYTELSTIDDHDEIEQHHEPVFLLHGLLGQKRNFATFGKALYSQLDKKRRIFALDLRNHGDNHHDWRDGMSHNEMSGDVLALMDELNLEKVIVIGHSMGGKVAMALALSQPDRISGLVVLDTSPVAYDAENNPAWKAVSGTIEALQEVQLEPGKTKRDVDIALRPKVEDPALRAFVLTNLDTRTGELNWKVNINSISSEIDKIAGFDVLNGVSESEQYEGDTFFINGGASPFVKCPGHMPIISQYFPNYMITTIRGAGHWVHSEAPDDTLALLKRYLDR